MGANTGIIGHETIHLFLTVLIASFFYWLYRDWRLIVASFLFGFFIDLDHWFDYFVYFGFRINLASFFDVKTYFFPSERVFVPLHGWEFLFIFWIFGKWAGKKLEIKSLEWVVSLAYLSHLLWDNFSFPHHPLAYSFIFRVFHHFALEKFNF